MDAAVVTLNRDIKPNFTKRIIGSKEATELYMKLKMMEYKQKLSPKNQDLRDTSVIAQAFGVLQSLSNSQIYSAFVSFLTRMIQMNNTNAYSLFMDFLTSLTTQNVFDSYNSFIQILYTKVNNGNFFNYDTEINTLSQNSNYADIVRLLRPLLFYMEITQDQELYKTFFILLNSFVSAKNNNIYKVFVTQLDIIVTARDLQPIVDNFNSPGSVPWSSPNLIIQDINQYLNLITSGGISNIASVVTPSLPVAASTSSNQGPSGTIDSSSEALLNIIEKVVSDLSTQTVDVTFNNPITGSSSLSPNPPVPSLTMTSSPSTSPSSNPGLGLTPTFLPSPLIGPITAPASLTSVPDSNSLATDPALITNALLKIINNISSLSNNIIPNLFSVPSPNPTLSLSSPSVSDPSFFLFLPTVPGSTSPSTEPASKTNALLEIINNINYLSNNINTNLPSVPSVNPTLSPSLPSATNPSPSPSLPLPTVPVSTLPSTDSASITNLLLGRINIIN